MGTKDHLFINDGKVRTALERHGQLVEDSEFDIDHAIKCSKMRQLYRIKTMDLSLLNDHKENLIQVRIQSQFKEAKRKHYNAEAAAEKVVSRAAEKVAWL